MKEQPTSDEKPMGQVIQIDEARIREQSGAAPCRAICGGANRGAGGAKGGDQGECGPAKHAPDADPGSRDPGAGPRTASRSALRCQTPKVGAGCLSRASPDLCGGRPVMAVPTAIRRANLEKDDVQADPKVESGKADTDG